MREKRYLTIEYDGSTDLTGRMRVTLEVLIDLRDTLQAIMSILEESLGAE